MAQIIRVLLFSCFTFLMSAIHQCDGAESPHDVQLWKNANIVPQVISSAPPQLAEVIFKGGAVIATGQSLSVSEVSQGIDSIAYPYSSNNLYTFMMLDTGSRYLQWLSVNNPGLGGNNENVGKGNEIAKYFGPQPPSGSGTHTYAVLVYKQNYRISSAPYNNRNGFDPNTYASQNGLGSTDAGNFFIMYT